MDTSLFDNIYIRWSEKVPQIMRNTIKNDFFLKNDVFLRLFNEEAIVKYWIDLVLTDSTKYDILAWLKAKANTSPIENGPIDFTQNGVKKLYQIKDKKFYAAFQDGKKRYREYYKDELFKYDLPPFFLCVYSKKSNSKYYNPFSRHDRILKPESYFELKKDFENSANIYIDMVKDEEIKNCQIITKEYYLEKTYGFQIKQIMANIIADIPVYNFIYQHDYRKNLIKNALVGFFENQTLNFALPSKYDNLNLASFKKLITFCSSKELIFLNKSMVSQCGSKDTLNSKDIPDSGYILMVLLFANEVLFNHINNINECIKKTRNDYYNDLSESFKVSKEISLKTQGLFYSMIKLLSFSLPGEGHLTYDEKILLTGIKEKVNNKIEVRNESFSREPEFVKKLLARVKNEETGEVCDINDLTFSDEEEPIKITMPSEGEIVLRFYKHYYSTLCKLNKHRFIHSSSKRIMNKTYKSVRILKNKFIIRNLNADSKKLAGTEIRSFKNLVIELMLNCFNMPTIAKYDDEIGRKYVLLPLPTHSKAAENKLGMLKSFYDKLNNNRHILISLRNTVICEEPKEPYWDFRYFWDNILCYILDDLYYNLLSLFNTPNDYKDYISRIYNLEVLDHINKKWFFKGKINYQSIDPKLLKQIVDLQ